MLDDLFADPACRVCGCTEARACVDPELGVCWWVAPLLCSHCAVKSRVQLAASGGLIVGFMAGLVVIAIVLSVWAVAHG